MVILSLVLLSKNNLKAQDIHFSQFYNSPLNINPALTGIFNGDVRIIGSMRDQWRVTSVPYTTFSGNYDMKIYPKKFTRSFFGFGAIFNYDNAGESNYNVTDINLTGSYSYLLNQKNVLTVGALLGFATEGYNANGNLTWDNYWTGEVIDPNLGSGEPNGLGNRVSYLETGAGINYRYQKSKRTNINIGAGFFHLLPPNNSFYNNNRVNLPIRIAPHIIGTFKIIDPMDIQVHGLANLQDQYNEFVMGGLVRLHINRNRGKEAALDIGGTGRISDNNFAFIAPTVALHYRQFYLSGSYDFNLNNVSTDLGSGRGGPEIHFRYIITKVKPLSQEKTCPIF